eukprot:SM000298S10958  [mRNA]  locus=s298:46730:52180:- [translate_table: standard]
MAVGSPVLAALVGTRLLVEECAEQLRVAGLRRGHPLLEAPQQRRRQRLAAGAAGGVGWQAAGVGWLANAVVVRTFFNPDEYWQCTEVAHRLAFGYGELTWEWRAGLRGYAHPLVFAALFVALVGTVALDSWMYGRPVAVPLEFLRFNGFPVMLGTLLPLAALGAWWSLECGPAWLVLWTLACYSPLPHKEFRFVLPVLPLAITYAGHALALLEARSWAAAGEWRQDAGAAAAAEPQARPALTTEAGIRKSDGSPAQRPSAGARLWSRPFATCVAALFATQIIPGLYFSVVHQRGSIVVMDYLSREAGAGRVAAVTFLMPCHSTPFYSHRHRNVPMHYLDCSPRGLEVGPSDSTAFLADPGSFVRRLYENETTMPSHLVLFDTEEPKLRDFLQERGYSEARRFFHAHFPVDRELQNCVLVYTRTMSRK